MLYKNCLKIGSGSGCGSSSGGETVSDVVVGCRDISRQAVSLLLLLQLTMSSAHRRH